MSPLDHGVLSMPNRLNTIDRDLDRYKAEKAAEAKKAAKEAAKLLKEQRVQAKAILSAMTPERIAQLAANTKTTPGDVRSMLKSIAYFEPARLIKTEGGAK